MGDKTKDQVIGELTRMAKEANVTVLIKMPEPTDVLSVKVFKRRSAGLATKPLCFHGTPLSRPCIPCMMEQEEGRDKSVGIDGQSRTDSRKKMFSCVKCGRERPVSAILCDDCLLLEGYTNDLQED